MLRFFGELLARAARQFSGGSKPLPPSSASPVVPEPLTPHVPGVPRFAMATVVGRSHLEEGRENEDRVISVTAADNRAWAWAVIDGAGGEDNGGVAADAVKLMVRRLLQRLITTWTDRDSLEKGLHYLFDRAQGAAFGVNGCAILVVYVYREDGLWGALQVGDAVFTYQDPRGKWHLPLHPFKMRPKRNVTLLLGRIDTDHAVLVDTTPVSAFLLSSDWTCGETQASPILDTTSSAHVGAYVPNASPLNALLAGFLPGDVPLSEDAAQDLLVAIRNGQVATIGQTGDDISVIAGKMICLT